MLVDDVVVVVGEAVTETVVEMVVDTVVGTIVLTMEEGVSWFRRARICWSVDCHCTWITSA